MSYQLFTLSYSIADDDIISVRELGLNLEEDLAVPLYGMPRLEAVLVHARAVDARDGTLEPVLLERFAPLGDLVAVRRVVDERLDRIDLVA